MNTKRRTMKPEDFHLFEGGRLNFDWPKSYNFLTGKVDFEAPEKKHRQRKVRLMLAEE